MLDPETLGHLCQTEADLKGPIHSLHGSDIQTTKSSDNPLSINGTDLVQDDNGASREAALSRLDNDLGGVGRSVES